MHIYIRYRVFLQPCAFRSLFKFNELLFARSESPTFFFRKKGIVVTVTSSDAQPLTFHQITCGISGVTSQWSV